MWRRAVAGIACVVALAGCAGGGAEEGDEFAALVPQLDTALSVVSESLICPGSEVTEREFDPLVVGSLEEHGRLLPDQVVLGATMSLTRAGEQVRVAIWRDDTTRPVAMQVLWEFDDGDYGLRRTRWCGS